MDSCNASAKAPGLDISWCFSLVIALRSLVAMRDLILRISKSLPFKQARIIKVAVRPITLR